MDELEVIQRFTRSPPVDVVGIIRALGIIYREKEMRPEQSGYFARRGGSYEIGVNSLDYAQRKRFTAAHELGHYVLHRDLLQDGEHFDRLFGAAARSNPVYPFTRHHEIQANRFAADVIMPAEHVSREFLRQIDVSNIAEKFGVSLSAMEIRLKNLGLR